MFSEVCSQDGQQQQQKNDVKMAKDITDAGVLSGNAYDAPPPNNKKIKAHAEGPHTTVPGSKQHPLVANLLTGDYASDAVKHGVEHTLSAVVRDFGDDEEIRTAAVEMYNASSFPSNHHRFSALLTQV